jgi:ABC-2 type transport system permease protein
MGQLKTLAGSHASDIPPPPAFPAPPPADFAQAASAPPPDLNAMRASLTEQLKLAPPDTSAFTLPPIPAAPKVPAISLAALSAPIVLPGSLGLEERDAANQPIEVATGFNTFDLQVPGFGITFLLIGMLMGISLAVIDEHDWGTLERLRSVAAPFAATLAGKLVARFIVGFAQLVVLFAAGWVLFGISLGAAPWALLMPTASIAFAGAAFGLMVAGAGSRDSVLPIGAIVIMTVAAIGGCWWPIVFEPPWMRIVALAVPTTWTMQAYNDLMIRGLPAISAVVPSLINVGFGLVYMTVGLFVVRRRLIRG